MPPTLNERLREYLDRVRATLATWWSAASTATRRATTWTQQRAEESARGLGDETRERAPGAAAALGGLLRATGRALARAGRWLLYHRPRSAPPPTNGLNQPLSLERAAIIVARREDDAASITGRIDTAPEIEVVLVVPRQARRLRQPSVWPHLAAHARRHGVTLRVASPRGDVRRHARDNGLRAVRRIEHLRRGQGIRIRFGDAVLRIPTVAAVPFLRVVVLLAIVGGGIAAACYQIPSATIMVAPNSETFSTTRDVRLNPVVQTSDLTTGVVRAGTIREEVSTIVTTATTGEAEVGDAAATVTLTFSNDGEQDFTAPAGTAVDDAEGIAFLTDEEVVVPAGGSESVTATAEVPGPIAHVPAQTLTRSDAIPPEIQVTNPLPPSGGTTRLARAVAAEDVERVQETAAQIIRRVSAAALAELGGDDIIVFEETINTAIFSEVPLQQLEEPSDVLIVEYVIIVSAIVLRLDEAADLGEEMIREDLPPHLALLSGTTAVQVLGEPQVEAGQVHATLEASGQVADISGLNGVTEELTGKTPDQAMAVLQERLAPVVPPRITISPELVPWRWMPWRDDRIRIFVVGPDFFEEDDEEEPDDADQPPADPLDQDLEGDPGSPGNGADGNAA